MVKLKGWVITACFQTTDNSALFQCTVSMMLTEGRLHRRIPRTIYSTRLKLHKEHSIKIK
uniref:Uncharacterized protein n=1 Tax=Anguilla anguilla TaxID=7936 RepID=A0A0E9X9V8_ANGAN